MGYTQDWKQSKQQVYKHQLINIQNDRNGSLLGRSHHNYKRTTSDIDAPFTIRGNRMRQHGLQLHANRTKLLLLGDRKLYNGRGERAMCYEGRNSRNSHEKVDYDMLKGVVHEKYEFSEENNQLAVFWLDQMFDYD